MDQRRHITISKYLSRHLRHRPDRLGLVLEAGGWVPIDTLLKATAAAGMTISRDELDQVVANCPKQRFGIDETGLRIRANQGHSVTVDLELVPQTPPDVLYHGTAKPYLEQILREGLRPMRRHHVHLSSDRATARNVGSRHGQAIILKVDAAALHAAGAVFYCSANGVWLVDHVPPAYLHQGP